MIAEEETRRQAILDFIRRYFKRQRKPPSIRDIERALRGSGVNRDNFYDLFENMEEACTLAGIHTTDQSGKTRAALEGRKEKQEQHEKENKSALPGITLTQKQTLRLAGMSHFEHGKDILEIVDSLLENDSTLRNLGLDFDKMQRIIQFLELALKSGWHLSDPPNILDATAQLLNFGFLRLDAKTAANVISISYQLKERNWDPIEFVDYVSRNKEIVDAYVKYMKGEISFEMLKVVMDKYVL